MTNTIARNVQSQAMASQTPTRPRFNVFPNTKLRPTRKAHMEIEEITMGKRTSLAARKVWGRVNANGHTVQTHILCICSSWTASSEDGPERL